MNERRGPGPAAYAVVVVILIAYFGWILDRMAAFTTNGFVRLDKLLIALGLVLLALGVAVGLSALASRRQRRRRDASAAENRVRQSG